MFFNGLMEYPQHYCFWKHNLLKEFHPNLKIEKTSKSSYFD